MKITAKNGKGNKIHISADGEYVATVDSDFWYSSKIINGDDITQDELTAFLEAVSFRRAYNRALDIISRRDHCKKELVKKLEQKMVDKQVAQDVVNAIGGLDL